jgi:hypothetical protein
MWMAPNFSRAVETMRAQSASRARSAVAKAAREGVEVLISAAVAASSDAVRAVRKTLVPSRAKRRAMARPMPRPEPVIRATLFGRSMATKG